MKATDDDAPFLLGLLPITVDPKSKARVEIRQIKEQSGMLPWAVPDVEPAAVAAIFVDEINGTVLPSPQLLLKQDIEVALCSLDQTAVQDAGGTSGCVMAGLRKLIDKANQYAAASSFAYGKPTDLHYAPTGATLTTALSSTFTYSAFRTMIKELRKAAGS